MNFVDEPDAESEKKFPEVSSGAFSIWGDIRLKGDAVLQVKVRGNIHAEQKLILTPAAEVSGWVKGGDICVEGKVEGGVEAQGQVWVKKGSFLRKQCVAQSLRIEAGSDFRGEIRVGS